MRPITSSPATSAQLSSVNVESLAAGDVDADGDNMQKMLADFGGQGLWLRDGGAWSQISGLNAD